MVKMRVLREMKFGPGLLQPGATFECSERDAKMYAAAKKAVLVTVAEREKQETKSTYKRRDMKAEGE